MWRPGYGGLGDIDRSVELSEKGYEERAPSMVYLKVGVMLDAGRDDPRIHSLLRRMNFPE